LWCISSGAFIVTSKVSSRFDEIVDRSAGNCVKWKYFDKDVVPMWVADMDFKSPEPIQRAVAARAAYGVFGYEMPPKSLSEAVCAWLLRRHGWIVQPDEIIFLPGLVSGLNLMCRAFGRMGEEAIVLPPVYPPFLNAPSNNGMTTRKVQLGQTLRNGRVEYNIDFDALERSFTPRASILLMCHPHNPIGREWTRNEMTQLAEMCAKRDAVIISDEIWGDLALEGTKHAPFASLSPEIAQRTVTLMAPSKTFNVPGLGCSFAVVQNPALKRRLLHAESGIIPHVNAFGLAAAEAAFTECDDWLDELRSYLTGNRDAMLAFIDEHMPAIRATTPQASYLGWLDCREAGIEGNAGNFFLKKARVALSDGEGFGPGGEGFVRFNFGCPRTQMMQALERMSVSLNVLKMK
jgi:cystathionine beta-lyase